MDFQNPQKKEIDHHRPTSFRSLYTRRIIKLSRDYIH